MSKRILKFRAWDKYSKKFIGLNKNDFFSIRNDGFIGINNSAVENPQKNYILNQFTGLLDKNGKELFDGDIVKFRHNADNIIGGQTEIGEVNFYEQVLGFGFKTGVESWNWMNYDEDLFDFEIIGNIFENKNLAKKLWKKIKF